MRSAAAAISSGVGAELFCAGTEKLPVPEKIKSTANVRNAKLLISFSPLYRAASLLQTGTLCEPEGFPKTETAVILTTMYC